MGSDVLGEGACLHEKFEARVEVNRFENQTPTGFLAEVRIMCVDCRLSFRFLGLPFGVDVFGVAKSFDGLVARLAIDPGPEPHPALEEAGKGH